MLFARIQHIISGIATRTPILCFSNPEMCVLTCAGDGGAFHQMTSIAILGATGHIGKSLLFTMRGNRNYKTSCYSRSRQKLESFLFDVRGANEIEYFDNIDAILTLKHDVIVNCIGVGNPSLLHEIGPGILSLTERFDDLILEYLSRYPTSLYINLSSGAVYGTEFPEAVDSGMEACIPINNITPSQYYRTAKICSEVKHRAHKDRRIVDLRVFSFFSRFVDLSSSYLVTDLIRCSRDGETFLTDDTDIVRDFIDATDLVQVIKACVDSGFMNTAFDLYSKRPVTKWEMIRYFQSKYDLKVTTSTARKSSVTGAKSNYYSQDRRLHTIGYAPAFGSLETIANESALLMQ